jgi:hypothetical protein
VPKHLPPSTQSFAASADLVRGRGRFSRRTGTRREAHRTDQAQIGISLPVPRGLGSGDRSQGWCSRGRPFRHYRGSILEEGTRRTLLPGSFVQVPVLEDPRRVLTGVGVPHLERYLPALGALPGKGPLAGSSRFHAFQKAFVRGRGYLDRHQDPSSGPRTGGFQMMPSFSPDPRIRGKGYASLLFPRKASLISLPRKGSKRSFAVR